MSAKSRLAALADRGLLRDRRRWPLAGAALALIATIVFLLLRDRAGLAGQPEVDVRRETLAVRLVEPGVLRPVESLTYQSPLASRDVEVSYLVPEGAHVVVDDLLVRLDTSELAFDVLRARQALRQAETDVQSAGADRADTSADLESLTSGEKSLDIDESRMALKLAEARAERLRKDHESLQPLLAEGYITRDELDRAASELEQAQLSLELARRKSALLVEKSRPREQQRARVRVSEAEARQAQAQERLAEAARMLQTLESLRDGCDLRARSSGVAVYEESLAANPRRKIRVGDRVTASQGLVTVSSTANMTVETSVREADVHLVKPGQRATVSLDAFPDTRLTGTIARIGMAARIPQDRPYEGKRYDLVVAIDGANAELRPEMTARVDILIDERPNVLVVPVAAVQTRDGKAVVLVRSGLGVRERPVELGRRDAFRVEVTRGLQEGDRVVLPLSSPSGPSPAPVPESNRPGLR